MVRQPILEEQHQIPQQISAFQFHLVGDMTLKQFLQLAAGALIALLIYSSNLAAIIKWPLIFISFGFGAALAFLPLEDRPLGKWIISFFKSIYSPTVFVWKKATEAPRFFAPETSTEKAAPASPATATTPQKAATIPEEVKLEEQEKSFLSKITHMTDSASTAQPAQTVAYDIRPVISDKTTGEVPIVQHKKEKKEVLIPTKGSVKVEKSEQDKGQVFVQEGAADATSGQTGPIAPVLSKGTLAGGKQAKFSPEAAPPMPPSKPNTIAGQVVDQEGKIVEGAILEIKDAEGRPVRALKTNRLGHFIIVTSLVNGKYEIITDKEGLVFDPITFEAKGGIIPPIAVWAKSNVN